MQLCVRVEPETDESVRERHSLQEEEGQLAKACLKVRESSMTEGQKKLRSRLQSGYLASITTTISEKE